MSLGKRFRGRCPHDLRDHRSGLIGVPRWYRHEHGAWVIRRREKHKLHLHLKNESWEEHLPESRFRDTMYYWWY